MVARAIGRSCDRWVRTVRLSLGTRDTRCAGAGEDSRCICVGPSNVVDLLTPGRPEPKSNPCISL